MSIYLSIYMSIHVSISMSIHLSISMPIYLYISMYLLFIYKICQKPNCNYLLLFLSLGEVALRETLALKTGLLLVLAGDGPSLSSIRLLRSRSLLLSRLLSFDSSWRALRLGGVRDRLSLRPLSFS